MGRRPASEAEHILHGTKRHSPAAKDSLSVAGYPAFPPHLNKRARAEFKRCCGLMAAVGSLTAGDYAILATYAVIFSRWIECKAALDADGLMVTTEVCDSNGSVHSVKRLHPLLKIAQDCEKQILALASKLGLTPIDREKVVGVPPDPRTPNSDGVIPGSMADLHPELFGRAPRIETPAVPFEIPSIDEENENDDTND